MKLRQLFFYPPSSIIHHTSYIFLAESYCSRFWIILFTLINSLFTKINSLFTKKTAYLQTGLHLSLPLHKLLVLILIMVSKRMHDSLYETRQLRLHDTRRPVKWAFTWMALHDAGITSLLWRPQILIIIAKDWLKKLILQFELLRTTIQN